MPSQFRVEKVLGKEDWESNFGPMLEWILTVRDLASDRVGNVSINSKPDNEYKVGETFWAEHKGERQGMAKLKRVQPPPGGAPAPKQQSAATASAPPPAQSGAVSYAKAVDVYKRMARDFDKEHGYEHQYATTMFLAWLNGKIADPEDKGRGMF